MTDKKITAFTDLADPAPDGAVLPVAVPDDTTNYKIALSRLGGGGGTGFTANESGDQLTVQGETGNADRSGQTISIMAGNDGTVGQNGAGSVVLQGGDDVAGGGAGGVTLAAGLGNNTSWGGGIALTAGSGGVQGATGGYILCDTGTGYGADNRGGEFRITLGTGSSGALAGLLKIVNLVTADPHVANAVWNDGGTLKISSG